MIKIILANTLILFALLSESAMAEWVRVDSNDKVTVYADPSTSRKKLYIVRVSSLFDFKAEHTSSDGKTYQSIMRETDFNCRENLQRMVSFSIHSGKMAKGKVLNNGSDPQDWQPVSKSGIAQSMKNFACK